MINKPNGNSSLWGKPRRPRSSTLRAFSASFLYSQLGGEAYFVADDVGHRDCVRLEPRPVLHHHPLHEPPHRVRTSQLRSRCPHTTESRASPGIGATAVPRPFRTRAPAAHRATSQSGQSAPNPRHPAAGRDPKLGAPAGSGLAAPPPLGVRARESRTSDRGGCASYDLSYQAWVSDQHRGRGAGLRCRGAAYDES